jgi:hypothetical protein
MVDSIHVVLVLKHAREFTYYRFVSFDGHSIAWLQLSRNDELGRNLISGCAPEYWPRSIARHAPYCEILQRQFERESDHAKKRATTRSRRSSDRRRDFLEGGSATTGEHR